MNSKEYNAKKLFLLSCIALVTTAMTFAIRARLEPVYGELFGMNKEQIGWAFGTAFWGFTLAQFIGGPLVDLIGMKRFIWIAFIMHTVGIVLTIMATGFLSLFLGTLFIGVGNGSIEAGCNPLVARIFPDMKTKMLNRFHVWFPGGIVIGGLLAYLIQDVLKLDWPYLVATLFIPLIVYGSMMFGLKFPKTERVEMGISYGSMWKAILKPLFLIMLFCMLFTAATELTTTQRIETLLKDTGVAPILILAFINGIMAIGRLFAGPVVHRINTTGMLFFSAIVSMVGLLLLSYVSSSALTILAAGIFAIGICFFWPTMLGFVSENVPESGALGLSILSGAGMLSISIFLPISGAFTDHGATGQEILRYTAVLPALLIVIFAIVFTTIMRKKTKTA
ncbi:MAG: MFS transporter [Porphyromonadaceae bacterium]|nr:MAG: MFS transporter [Porphyromonadaceae bacterium]